VFSTFYLIAEEFRENVSSLGLIAATMTIGIGLFQIPGGIIAAKYHPKTAAMLGMATIAISSLLVMLSTNIYQIAIFRFVLGAGLAFYFPSAIVLITEYFRKGSEAFAVGTIVGANAAGGAMGLIMWAIIAGLIGWRSSIMIAAILAAIAAAAILVGVQGHSKSNKMTTSKLTGQWAAPTSNPESSSDNNRSFIIRKDDIIVLLKDKAIILFGLLLLGSQATLEQTLGFMPFYLQSAIGIDPASAGLVSSFTLIASLAGSPIAGLIYDRRKTRFSLIVLVLGSTLFVGAALNFFQSLITATISTILVGFSGGGMFALFSNAARARIFANDKINSRHTAFATLSVNWVHAIALTGTFWVPLLFAFSTQSQGYTTSWPLVGAVSFVIIVAFQLVGKRIGAFGSLPIYTPKST